VIRSKACSIVVKDALAGHIWITIRRDFDPENPDIDAVDTDGEVTIKGEGAILLHDFMTNSRKVDINHDRVARNISVIEAFYNDEHVSSPLFPPYSVNVKLDLSQEPRILEAVKVGDLLSASWEAVVEHGEAIAIPVDQVNMQPYEGRFDSQLLPGAR